MSARPGAKDYLKSLSSDLPASIVVFLVALPLCLGVALASNAPLFSGIIAGVVGGIVVGIASRSHLSVSGPAAGLTAIVAAALLTLPSFEAFLVAVVIAGVLQILFGFLKAGIVGDYVPNAVIKGMLAAIGLILILNQFPHLLGDDSHFETDEGVVQDKGNIFSNFINAFAHITPVAFLIGGVCLAFHFIWEKLVAGRKGFIRLVPAPLLVVLIAVGINFFFVNSGSSALKGEHLVTIPQAQSAGEFFSFFAQPDWSQILTPQVWITGVTIALVASLESLLSIEAIDDLDPYQRVTPTNRELKAQGLGNLVSGLLGGLPVTSVIVRSSANVNSGARTKMSTIYHGTLLLLCVALIPGLLNLIPKAALAAILIFTGYKLAKPALFIAFYKKGMDQFIPFVVTIAAILVTDLLKGVIIGIGVGLFFVIRSNFRSAVFVVNDANKFLFRLRKDVSFLNKPIIKHKLEKVPEGSYVLIDASRADFIDKDIVETIEDFMIHAPLKQIRVELKLSGSKDQGFSKDLVESYSTDGHYTRSHDKQIKAVELQKQ
ncbi:MAG: SulP family inorganic anion transporter [Chitinophagaceae bacterium]|jgi:MFS superfamily sulfate permease-like transporter|nr:SulP family inorganic anion transporter [Chitinophagaceae bacterium]